MDFPRWHPRLSSEDRQVQRHGGRPVRSSRASAWGPESREGRLDSRADILERTGRRSMGRQRQRRIEHGRLKNQREETGVTVATGTC